MRLFDTRCTFTYAIFRNMKGFNTWIWWNCGNITNLQNVVCLEIESLSLKMSKFKISLNEIFLTRNLTNLKFQSIDSGLKNGKNKLKIHKKGQINNLKLLEVLHLDLESNKILLQGMGHYTHLQEKQHHYYTWEKNVDCLFFSYGLFGSGSPEDSLLEEDSPDHCHTLSAIETTNWPNAGTVLRKDVA